MIFTGREQLARFSISFNREMALCKAFTHSPYFLMDRFNVGNLIASTVIAAIQDVCLRHTF